jgi:hypothetical protein
MLTSLAEEANFGYAGSAGCRRRQLPRVWLLGLDGFGAASSRQTGRGCSSTARATVAPCAGLPHPWCSLRNRLHYSDAALGGCTRRRTPQRWRPRSWMVLSSPP